MEVLSGEGLNFYRFPFRKVRRTIPAEPDKNGRRGFKNVILGRRDRQSFKQGRLLKNRAIIIFTNRRRGHQSSRRHIDTLEIDGRERKVFPPKLTKSRREHQSLGNAPQTIVRDCSPKNGATAIPRRDSGDKNKIRT